MDQSKKRFIYIDLLRGWAVLVMVEVHVFNAFMVPLFHDEAWFKVLNFINGLVAPAFLFASGYAFVLVAQRKWDDYLHGTRILWKQLGRILQILAVGYALHLPVFSLTGLTNLSWDGWSVFWKVDVLHAIAMSLLVMLGLILLIRSKKQYIYGVVILAAIMIFGSPYMYDRNLDHILTEPISNYLTAAHRSQFPLFPWMGFVLCGGIASQIVLRWKETKSEQKIFTALFAAGIIMIIFSILIEIAPFSIYPEHDYWRSNPGFFFIRLGIVVMLLSTLWYWEQTANSGKSLVSIVGSESLVAYAGHLLIIYGQFFNDQSAAFLIGKTRTVPEVIGMTALLVAGTVSVSYVWHRIKNWSIFYARVLMYSVLIIVLFVFFTKPF